MRSTRSLLQFLIVVLLSASAACQSTVQSPDAYAPLTSQLQALVEREVADKKLPAAAVALVDDQRVVWHAAFGEATTDSVFRVGSVSKLFTDIAVMQMVETGELDLDAPLTTYLPEFRPANTFGGNMTLRQLMSHRSGLVREPPVGHYFDDTSPTLEATVRSLNSTSLVYPPEARVKYSNAGIAVVGYVLESLKKRPFPEYLAGAVLKPMGLEATAFKADAALKARLPRAIMWAYDGREFPAPLFELGMAPAGSMYTTTADLSRFMSVVFAGGQGPSGRVLQKDTLEAMWSPQFSRDGQTSTFGLGFALGSLDGTRRVGHGGAIYGYATELAMLPDQKLGAIVVIAADGVNAVAEHIADTALRGMYALKLRKPLPVIEAAEPIDPSAAAAIVGRYQAGDRRIEILRRGDEVRINRNGVWSGLRKSGSGFVIDGRLAVGPKLTIDADGLLIDGTTYAKVAAPEAKSIPPSWAGLIGEYGWDYNILFVYEKEGRLHALIEWFFDYPLTEVAPDTYAFPDNGLYHGERLVFERRPERGQARSVMAAGIRFDRRGGPADGETFRIQPVRPVSVLRPAALAATPPEESGTFVNNDLVELSSLDPTIKYDIRYASTNNFLGTPFYLESRAFLQRPAAEALVRAHRKLKSQGLGLLIHDGYRPWYVTKMFRDATPPDKHDFVADPSRGSRHNRGCAVDLTLFDLATGRPVPMVSGYDEFSERAYPDYPGGTEVQRRNREILRQAMEEEGFAVYAFEWWHFDYKDWQRYRIGNQTFDQLLGRNR